MVGDAACARSVDSCGSENDPVSRESCVDQLRDALDVEKQLTKALPRIAKTSISADVRQAIEDQLARSRSRVERLLSALASLGNTSAAATAARPPRLGDPANSF